MKIEEMNEIMISYENLIAFLKHDEIQLVEKLTDIVIRPNASFHSLVNMIIAQYKAKQINNKAASTAIEIIKNASRPKVERFRKDGQKVFEYNNGNYHFIGNYSSKEFKQLVTENGRFI